MSIMNEGLMEQDIFVDDKIGIEYKRALLLLIFGKLVKKLKEDSDFEPWVKKMFRQSFNKRETLRVVVRKATGEELDDNEVGVMLTWYEANQKKKPRIAHSDTEKKDLIEKQNGKCALCRNKLDSNLANCHLDHIIPYTLVGDELDNNYQILCEKCNFEKGAKLDYIFKKKIGLL